jgi:hypothetical protein
MYKLFVDDVRDCPKGNDWLVARSFREATEIMKRNGCPYYMSFDHDLGNDSKSGFELVKWMVERDLEKEDFFPRGFMFVSHSANPIGKENIETYLNNYLNFKNIV